MAKVDVQQEVAELLRRFGVDAAPVPVNDIAKGLGARLSFSKFDDNMSGILVRLKDGVIIGINSSHSPSRQRFSVAHEIAHLQLHEGKALYVDHMVQINLRQTQQLRYDPEETQANEYAATLLMPHDFISEAMTRLGEPSIDGQSSVVALAERFKVSPQAMEYRLTNLGLLLPS